MKDTIRKTKKNLAKFNVDRDKLRQTETIKQYHNIMRKDIAELNCYLKR